MSDYNNQAYAARPASGVLDAAIDQGLRAYMISVYQYMMLGLGVTGLVAYFVHATPTLYGAIYGNPITAMIAVFAPLAFVLYFSFRISTMSAATAQTTFWAFAALMGISLSRIFEQYVDADIVRVFFITSASFGALSLYGYTTPRSLNAWGSFLFMGLVGLIIASVVNFFMQSSAMTFAISVIGVLVFAGLTAYDTQKIKELYLESDDADTMGKKAIMGALNLYLDFINLFLFLLRLMANRD